MDNIIIPAWIGKVIYAIGIAGLLGTGSTILKNSQDVAVLQSQQSHVDITLNRIEAKLDRVIEEDHPRGPRQ